LREITQLLDPDSSPLRDGALTPDAESYILREMKKMPNQEPFES